MIKNSDLDAAVHEGIISQDQATQLRDLAKRLSTTGEELLDFSHNMRDEPFRLMRGFRDIFIAIGLAIFAFGLTSVAQAVTIDTSLLLSSFSGDAGDRLQLLGATIILVIAGILLSEWITRKQRLPLSSLVMSLAFAFWSAAFFTAIAVNLLPGEFADLLQGPVLALWVSLFGAIVGLVLFYWRYRLPFTLLPLAASAVALAFVFTKSFMGDAWSDDYGRILIGILGLGVFAAAMFFDIKDRLRVTRFAECGFWLHLLAAPMIVHALLLASDAESAAPGLILVTMTILCLVALLIDRRALLVSGLSYLTVAIGQLVAGNTGLADQGFALSATILGGILLVLGLAWTPIRRTIVGLLPMGGLRSILPPVAEVQA
jgi:MFS family permease